MISDYDFNKRMEEERLREQECKELLVEADVEVKEIDHALYIEAMKDVRKNWNTLDDIGKKQLVDIFVDRIYIGFNGPEMIIKSIDFY